MSAMQRLFELMSERNASDIFISAGAPINIKINGFTGPVNGQIVRPETVRGLMSEIFTPEQMAEFDREYELNHAHPVRNLGSYRISAFMQRASPAMVVRFIPFEIPAFDSLGLPVALKTIALEPRGLVLMVGATGSGKSTTLAAMIDHRNETLPGHIITVEDPIEFLFKHKKSIVNQRELGSDAKSYQIALKNALRQAPDVILISEIRDREAMSMALAYAQSGHLCLATLHANNSYQALNRVISFYPIENRDALLQDLSSSLRCIISQRLVRRTDGGRAPAVELLVNTRHVGELIEQGSVNQIREAIENSLAPGSQSFEQALFDMWRRGEIEKEEALASADSANNLLWLMNNTGSDAPAAPDGRPRPATAVKGEASTGVRSSNPSFSQIHIHYEEKTLG
jgi:twitching motility protein PilU